MSQTVKQAPFDPAAFKARREAIGLSQRALAEKAGILQITISSWETGKVARPQRSAYNAVLRVLEREERRAARERA